LDNPDQTPTFAFTVRSALSNFNQVADTALIELVVNAEFCSASYVFAVSWMFDLEVNSHFDAFVTAFAYHYTG
jgi:hypothetical protein